MKRTIDPGLRRHDLQAAIRGDAAAEARLRIHVPA
jgi:hypothetical protein